MNEIHTAGSAGSRNKVMMFALIAIAFMAIIGIATIGSSDDSDAASSKVILDDGLYYEIAYGEASVVKCYIGTYSGDIIIKSSVSYGGNNYNVKGIDSSTF